MIVALIAVSLSSGAMALPYRQGSARPEPCQAVPGRCLATQSAEGPRITDRGSPATDIKMNAYRFDARPCRIIGNLDCPKRANRQLFRLGEPIAETIGRSFGLR